MFDANNERTGTENNQTGMGFEHKVSDAVTGFLSNLFGQGMSASIERYMNEMGMSINDICHDPETVSEELKVLFGTAADILIDSMLREAFAAQGFESKESYTRFDLAHGLRRLRELSMTARKINGGVA